MKAYKLQFVMYDPSESTEPDKYMAEIPVLPGCRVWGDSPEETMDILQDVAAGIIETHVERGYELPEKREGRADPATAILERISRETVCTNPDFTAQTSASW